MGEKFEPSRPGHLLALAGIIGGMDFLVRKKPEIAKIMIPQCEQNGITFEHMIAYPGFCASGWIRCKRKAGQPLTQAEEDFLAKKGWK